jgi:peptidoglycan/LPS O-acetylase OafA/YrhL
LWSINDLNELLKSLFILLFNITLTQSFVPLSSFYFSFNSPSWSISNELFFYLLTPFLLVKLSKFNCQKITLVVAGFVLTILIGVNIIPENYHHSVFYINPIVRLFDFILGIFIYSIFKRVTLNLSVKISSFLEFGILILFALFFSFHNYVPEVYRFSIYYWLPMVGLIYMFSIGNGFITSILSKRIFVYLGEISFGFYLIHQLVIRYFGIIIRRFDIKLTEITQVILVFLISLILSSGSFEFFENRVRERMKSLLKKYLFRS